MAERAGKVPKVVFTTYYSPLPAPGADLTITKCPDALGLSAEQFSYLGDLLDQLNGLILAEIPRTGAMVADATRVMDGHKWCDKDPWAYGMSILLRDKSSLAPFHPTPTGQTQIADVVQGVLRNLNPPGSAAVGVTRAGPGHPRSMSTTTAVAWPRTRATRSASASMSAQTVLVSVVKAATRTW